MKYCCRCHCHCCYCAWIHVCRVERPIDWKALDSTEVEWWSHTNAVSSMLPHPPCLDRCDDTVLVVLLVAGAGWPPRRTWIQSPNSVVSMCQCVPPTKTTVDCVHTEHTDRLLSETPTLLPHCAGPAPQPATESATRGPVLSGRGITRLTVFPQTDPMPLASSPRGDGHLWMQMLA